jgi:superfamily II DNA or RNA helicase
MPVVTNFREVDDLLPADFELFVRDVLNAAGWTDLVVTKCGSEYAHGDGGVDIFGRRQDRRYAIQVKQRQSGTPVDVSALNQIVTGARLANVAHLILVTNSTFTSEVVTRALRLGVELIDRDRLHSLWQEKHTEIGRRIQPRTYQQAVIEEILARFAAGKRRFLIEMATGLGKTYTAAHLVKRVMAQAAPRRLRVLLLAHQVELLQQAALSFKNVLGIGNHSYSACFDGGDPEPTDLVFASFDTLVSKLPRFARDAFDLIIIDEAHHTPATTYATVAQYFEPALLVGLSATPFRQDDRDVLEFFGGSEGHVGRYNLAWALRHNKLAFPQYHVLLSDLDQARLDQLRLGASVADLDQHLFLHQRDEEVVRLIESTIEQKQLAHPKGIVFCRSIRHIRHLIQFFPTGSATLVHSEMPAPQRRTNIRDFREGDFRYILVRDLFNEGIDIPETNLLVFLRPTTSRTVWLQQLGRGLRRTKQKDVVHVLDFVGSLERLQQIQRFSREVEAIECDAAEREAAPAVIHHDSSLHVEYYGTAAQVLPLIESFEYLHKSRSEALELLRRFWREHRRVPAFESLASALPELSRDQIATHFNSYVGYLRSALGDDFDPAELRERCHAFCADYVAQHHLAPSWQAVSHASREEGLVAYTATEAESLLADGLQTEVDAYYAGGDLVPQATTLAGKVETLSGAVAPSPRPPDYVSCEDDNLVRRYAPRISSAEELMKLPKCELSLIRGRHPSLVHFWQLLERAREASTPAV